MRMKQKTKSIVTALLLGVLCAVTLSAVITVPDWELFHRKDYLEKKMEINEQELAALDYDTSSFDDGEAYIDPTHLYTYDLDVFGPHSLFQYINRTCTQPGKHRLAHWLGKHLERKEEIIRRQEAVSELAPELKFRQRFRILGLLYKGKAADETELCQWAESPSIFRSRKLLRLLPVLVTGANLICLALVMAGILSASSCTVKSGEDDVFLQSDGSLRSIRPVRTAPYPGFPTDAQPVLMAALLKSAGSTVFVENIFENRYRHVDELARMGAEVRVAGRVAVVTGREHLHGARVKCTDLRAGAALVIAGLQADGLTRISRIEHIDRGYESIERDLGVLGAHVRRETGT